MGVIMKSVKFLLLVGLLLAFASPQTGLAQAAAESEEVAKEEKKDPFFKRMMRTVSTLGQSEEDEIQRKQERQKEDDRQEGSAEQVGGEDVASPPKATPTPKKTFQSTTVPQPTPKATPKPTPAPEPVAEVVGEEEQTASDEGASALSQVPEFVQETTLEEDNAAPEEEVVDDAKPETSPRELYRSLRAEAIKDQEIDQLQNAVFEATSEAEHFEASTQFYSALFDKIKAAEDSKKINEYIDLMQQAANRKLERQRDRMQEVFEQRNSLLEEAAAEAAATAETVETTENLESAETAEITETVETTESAETVESTETAESADAAETAETEETVETEGTVETAETSESVETTDKPLDSGS